MCNYAESVGVFYCDPKEFAEKKDRFLNRLPVSLKQFDAILRDQTFLAGEEPTVPDFHFCEVLSEIVMMEPHCLQGFSRLQVRALPCLSRHVALISAHCTHWQSGLPRSLLCAARHRGLHEDRPFPQHSRQQQSGCLGCERN